MKLKGRTAAKISVVVLAVSGAAATMMFVGQPGQAQQARVAKAPIKSSQFPAIKTPAPKPQANNWLSQCRSGDRKQPLTCSIEQSVVLRQTGQQIAKFVINTVPETSSTYLIRLPLGLSMREGLTLRIDNNAPLRLDIQTCEASGCYAGDKLTTALLDGMRRGKTLNIEMVTNQKRRVAVPINLGGFSKSYDLIQ